MDKLTEKQKAVFLFIRDYAGKNGFAPTMHEIKDHFGWVSDNTSRCYISMLAKKGYIKHTPNIARGIKVLKRRTA